MDFLLFAGAQNTGKTSSIINYKNLLVSKYGYSETIILADPSIKREIYLLTKNNKKILVHPDTDLVILMDEVKRYIDLYNPQYVITACRNIPDHRRDRLFSILDINNPSNSYFEIPLGRMTNYPSHSTPWYLGKVLNVVEIIGSQPPFSF